MCRGKLGHSSIPARKDVLRHMYFTTSVLCVLMVVWILFAPGSWLIGRSKLHDDFLTHLGDQNSVVPPETLTKYAGHTAVHLTHILPGALWAGLIPFQLHPTFRSGWPRTNRIFGYTFFASAFLMSGGIVIIFKRDLFFEKFFPDSPPQNMHPSLFLLAWLFISLAHRSWDKRLDDASLINNMQKFRTYDPSPVRDLLRLIRNKHHHFDELPTEFKESNDVSNQDALLEYFEGRFPCLLMHCFNCCRILLKEEDTLAGKYFIVPFPKPDTTVTHSW